jgi:hypothetical protein
MPKLEEVKVRDLHANVFEEWKRDTRETDR